MRDLCVALCQLSYDFDGDGTYERSETFHEHPVHRISNGTKQQAPAACDASFVAEPIFLEPRPLLPVPVQYKHPKREKGGGGRGGGRERKICSQTRVRV